MLSETLTSVDDAAVGNAIPMSRLSRFSWQARQNLFLKNKLWENNDHKG